MTSRETAPKAEFVEACRDHVYGAAVRDTIAVLADPPGRLPSPRLVQLSEWYRSLSDADRENVVGVARIAADAATFGMLCVLDGARSAVDGVGYFRVEAMGRDGRRISLGEEGSLHEAYRGVVAPLGVD
jgi:hypothetical protein